ncbi:MAG: hypothetical protein MR514_01110, partial [Succinivibrio sp.]|nr:hypothetical protein [Succinivibrio sp.]
NESILDPYKSNNALLSYAYLGCFILHALFWCFNFKDLKKRLVAVQKKIRNCHLQLRLGFSK